MNIQTYSKNTNTIKDNRTFIVSLFKFFSTPQSTKESSYIQEKIEINKELINWTKEFISKYRKDFEALSKK